ncbi:hypothetical protein Nepgr_021099 [Nepenthes gracilis]|uniref:Uncharacterized protein n=1 Tax=Nepenthes gracilis TaxID=150966 RepID=A0AAD3XVU3_NEPGR|nr:hypothetical protein Nepgr_021099 [Nepenthes gracilis]
MPSEAAVEDAPTVVSTPSPHAVQCDLALEDDSARRIASDVERLRMQLMEFKDQCCLDQQLPCSTQAARESVPDGSSSGSEAAMQGMSLCGANASPNCHQGPPARWTDEELFARQAINGSLRTVLLIPAVEADLPEILWDPGYRLFAVSLGGLNPYCGAIISLPDGSWLAVVLVLGVAAQAGLGPVLRKDDVAGHCVCRSVINSAMKPGAGVVPVAMAAIVSLIWFLRLQFVWLGCFASEANASGCLIHVWVCTGV